MPTERQVEDGAHGVMAGEAPLGYIDGTAISDVRRKLMALLAEAEIISADSDARRLVLAATNVHAIDLIRYPNRQVTVDEAERLQAYAARRLKHEPVTRILGEREFYGRTFTVTPDTLDPRADSETLIQVVLNYISQNRLRAVPLRIIDVGTGTGCLILTLLAEVPTATGLAIDISDQALDVARRNAERLGVTSRVTFLKTNGLDGIEETADILVSNPPYIVAADIAKLDPDVRLYDPQLALDGGPDGLTIYRAICQKIKNVVPQGLAAFEVGGHDQALMVAELLKCVWPSEVSVTQNLYRDLSGHTRCVAVEIHR